MNGKEFYALYAKRMGISKAAAEDYCRGVLETLDECFDVMDADERISFYGFGTFVKKHTAPHIVGDLFTGLPTEIPGYNTIKFVRSRTNRR